MPRVRLAAAFAVAVLCLPACQGDTDPSARGWWDSTPPTPPPPPPPPPGDTNWAPYVTNVTLTPAAPITTDDLRATATAYDPDGDAVTLSYAWRRNGAVLSGETAATLPASHTTRGDLITVSVTASDGALTATAQASVTIQDAPPQLATVLPGEVTWGQPVTFTLAASDPDGDPVAGDLTLVYGPAGMTISGDTVSWTPTLPMFDAAMDVHFGVASAASPSVAMQGTLHVVDPGRAYALRRTGFEIPSTRNGFFAGDLDGDGDEELLVASFRGVFELANVGGAYAQVWALPFAVATGQGATAVAARDLDGDGHAEIFVSQANVLLALDGVARREVARVEVPSSPYSYSTTSACTDLEVADVDADGAPELVCLRPASSYSYESLARVLVLDPVTLATRWESSQASLGGDLAVGQLDDDGALEIVTAAGYVFDGASGATEWTYATGFGTAVDTGDLDGDGVEEIVASPSGRIVGYSAVWESPLWEWTTTSYYGANALVVADADGDGTQEIVAGDTSWGPIAAYRYRPATNDLALAFEIPNPDGGASALAVADLDGDGTDEVAWGAGGYSSGKDVLVVAGRDGTGAWGTEWASRDPSQLDGPFVGGDLASMGGGAARLLFASPTTNSGYDGTRLVQLDPATGVVSTSAELGDNWNNWAALATADFDADGVDEAFLTTAYTYDGYFVVYDPALAAAQWTSDRTVGDGRAVVAADVSGDGVADLVAITTEGKVQAWDATTGTRVWSSVTIGGTGMDLAVRDLDADGVAEIVALTSTRLVVYRYSAGAPVPWLEAASASVAGRDLEVVVQDGAPELYVLVGSYGSGSAIDRYDASATLLSQVTLSTPATSLHVEDLGQARHNLLVVTGPTYSYETTPSRLRAIDPVTGAEIWTSPPLFGAPGQNSVHYVDWNGDGRRELAVGTASSMYLTR
jgi:hypothetical protein